MTALGLAGVLGFIIGVLATLLTIVALASPVLAESDRLSDESLWPPSPRDWGDHPNIPVHGGVDNETRA